MLSEHDLSALYEKLSPFSYKWKEIATHLGFISSELSNIEANPMHLLSEPPKSYLSAMLSSWLQWAPGDARGSVNYATVSSLRTAMDKAGLGSAARDLKIL